MVDFYLHEYSTTDSAFRGIVAPHKYRFASQRNMQTDMIIDAWIRDRNTIIRNYITRMDGIYDVTDNILLFSPPTITRIFIDDIIQGIISHFPNIIDYTNIFSKRENISFGNSTYNDCTLEELAEFVTFNKELLDDINIDINKVFIVDDVYASGKSIALTEHLIRNNTGLENLEINSGVVLLMP